MEKTQSPFSKPATFRYATLGLLAILAAAGAPSPLYGLYASEFGFSISVLTVVFAVYALALLVTMLIVGSLSDHTGRKPVLFAALTLEIVSLALFLLAGGVAGLIIARLIQGVATGAAIGTLGAILLDTEGRQAGRATVVNSIVSQVGFVVGAVGAGALAEYAPAPLELVFWVLIAIFAALFVAALLIPETGESRPGARRSLRPEVTVPKRVRGTFYAAVPLFVANWAVSGLYVSLGGSIVKGVFGYPNLFVGGLIVAAMLGPGAIASYLMRSARPRTAIRFGSTMLIAGLSTTVVGLALGVGPLGFVVFVVGTVVAGIGFGSAYVGAFGSTMAEVPSESRAATLTAILGVSYLSFSIPALIAGVLTADLGIRTTAIGYGAAVIAIALGSFAIERLRDRQTTDRAEIDSQSGAVSAMPSSTLVSRTFSTPRQTTHYIECGPVDGPLMIFLHGWPSIGLIWHAQLDAFAADGWHCVAPDLRGFGSSSAPAATDAYTTREVVADLVEIHDHLGGQPAIWVGHDWGSVVAGALAAHEPKRSRGVVLTSWAYFPGSNALATLVPLVDRTIYPADDYPDGQWDYFRYYATHFELAVADLDADQAATLASVYRPGSPAAVGEVSPTAMVTRNGGRFGAAHRAPVTRADPALWPPADFDLLVQAFKVHGFRPASAWYVNDDANIAFAREAPDGGRLSQPVLFVNGDWDAICSIIGNRQGDPMRAACSDLTMTSLPAGHWLPLERKTEHIQAIRTWLQSKNL